jgi:hypothetical protein
MASRCLCLNKYYSSDEIMEDEMNGACDMCGRGVKCVQGCGGETLYDIGINGSMILKCILYRYNGRRCTGFI